MFNKAQITYFICTMVMVSILFGYLGSFLPGALGVANVFSIFLWMVVLLGFTLVFRHRIYLTTTVIMLGLYALMLFLMVKVGHLPSVFSTRFRSEVFPMLLALVMCQSFTRYHYQNQSTRSHIISVLVLIGIACIINIVGLYRSPSAVRYIVGGRGSDEELARYLNTGILGYGFFSGLPPLIPSLVFLIRHSTRRINKIMASLLIVLIFAAIIFSTITTPIIIASLALLFSLALQKTKHYLQLTAISAIIVVLLVVFTPQKLVVYGLDALIYITPSKEAVLRLQDVQKATEGGFEVTATSTEMTSFEARFQRYIWNLEAFMRNPLFGSPRGLDDDAFHLYWAYLLANFGIIGAAPLLMMFYFHFSQNMKVIAPDYKRYYTLSVLSFIAMGMTKVIGGWFMYLIPLTLVPIIGTISWEEGGKDWDTR